MPPRKTSGAKRKSKVILMPIPMGMKGKGFFSDLYDGIKSVASRVGGPIAGAVGDRLARTIRGGKKKRATGLKKQTKL